MGPGCERRSWEDTLEEVEVVARDELHEGVAAAGDVHRDKPLPVQAFEHFISEY